MIAASPEEVFDYRLDFAANLMTYNPNVKEVRQIQGNGPGPGSKYRVRVRLGPGVRSYSTLTVTEASRPTRVCDDAEASIPAHEEVTFEPVSLPGGAAGTAVRFLVVTSPRGLFARLADTLLVPGSTRRQVRTELNLMRQHLEARRRH